MRCRARERRSSRTAVRAAQDVASAAAISREIAFAQGGREGDGGRGRLEGLWLGRAEACLDMTSLEWERWMGWIALVSGGARVGGYVLGRKNFFWEWLFFS